MRTNKMTKRWARGECASTFVSFDARVLPVRLWLLRAVGDAKKSPVWLPASRNHTGFKVTKVTVEVCHVCQSVDGIWSGTSAIKPKLNTSKRHSGYVGHFEHSVSCIEGWCGWNFLRGLGKMCDVATWHESLRFIFHLFTSNCASKAGVLKSAHPDNL